MEGRTAPVDAVVVGGGFYGSVIATYLAKVRGLERVVLLEREEKLLQRASLNNQARVHNGYHYPRSYVTAFRSRINFPQFVADWPSSVYRRFTKLYAIARRGSKVNAAQFARFCRAIGADLAPAPRELCGLFSQALVEQAFVAEEYAFDATQLASWAGDTLAQANVAVRLQSQVCGVHRDEAATDGGSIVRVRRADGETDHIPCRYVVNCTYSGINHLGGEFSPLRASIKHELTEIAYVRPPGPLLDVGVTVMDGPFFSVMPFPPRGLHSLSHVRYTPRASWLDRAGENPYDKLEAAPCASRVDQMIRDVSRYIPSFATAEYGGSSFEVKTVLQDNEADDGRPIVFEHHQALPGCFSVLGAKIDNIYDVLHSLNEQEFVSGGTPCTMH
jgi:glycine/D-amino acid oxidase-like deaminating enzyme